MGCSMRDTRRVRGETQDKIVQGEGQGQVVLGYEQRKIEGEVQGRVCRREVKKSCSMRGTMKYYSWKQTEKKSFEVQGQGEIARGERHRNAGIGDRESLVEERDR